jgi:hypothetical protein
MHGTWLATAAAAVAAGAALVAPTLRSSPVPAPRPVPPKTLTVDGVVVGLAGVEKVVAVRLEGPSTLAVYAGSRRSGPPAYCEEHTEVRVLAQDASQVRLGAFRYVVRESPGREIACPSIGRPAAEARIALAAPLGDRRVVANDVPVAVHDPAVVLRASGLPGGVAAAGTVTFDPASETWSTVHAGPLKGQVVTVGQGPIVRPSAYRSRRVFVRGRPAALGEVFGGQCVWWTERPRVGMVVCAQGSPVPLTREELLRVAEDLR